MGSPGEAILTSPDPGQIGVGLRGRARPAERRRRESRPRTGRYIWLLSSCVAGRLSASGCAFDDTYDL